MIIISHRGCINGSDYEVENSPKQIDKVIDLGFDVEVDLRTISNDRETFFYLGHDNCQYVVDYSWLHDRKTKLWIHCKDLDSLYQLMNRDSRFRCFYHENDPVSVVTPNYLWVHDLSLKLNDRCIVPVLSERDINFINQPYGICTDYPIDWKSIS